MDVTYYGYRWYDPVTGRWPSRDPIGERGGMSLYAFNTNDAIALFDALGLEPKGHHIVPQALWKGVRDELAKIFDSTKNRICHADYNLHNGKLYNGISEVKYRAAVKEAIDEFLKGRNLNDLTPGQAQDLADKIRNSSKTNIKMYLQGVRAELRCCVAEAKKSRTTPAQPAMPANKGKTPGVRAPGLGRSLGIVGNVLEVIPLIIHSTYDVMEAERRAALDPSKTLNEHLNEIGEEQIKDKRLERWRRLGVIGDTVEAK
jgi:hypothetical protein